MNTTTNPTPATPTDYLDRVRAEHNAFWTKLPRRAVALTTMAPAASWAHETIAPHIHNAAQMPAGVFFLAAALILAAVAGVAYCIIGTR